MDSLEIWENSLANRAEGTRKRYFHYFDSFVKFVGCSPDEIRTMKHEEDQDAKPWDRNKVENLLRKFLKMLEEKKMTCSTQNLALASIKSFFLAQGLPLFMKRSDKPQGCAFGSKALTPKEIRKIKSAAEYLRDKALIMFLKDSGLRKSDAAKLKWGDFKDYGDGFWGFQIQTKKRGVKARGFIGSEATDMLKIYKKKRMEGTKKIEPEKNIEEHPVFALLSKPSKVVIADVLTGIVGRIIRRSGIEKASGHGFRKFWEQNMHVEHEAYQKQMNGRTLDGVERAYFWLETEQLFDLYRSNYYNLRIEQTDFKDTEERIRRDYEREIRILKNQLEERNSKSNEMAAILEKMKPLAELVEDSSKEDLENLGRILKGEYKLESLNPTKDVSISLEYPLKEVQEQAARIGAKADLSQEEIKELSKRLGNAKIGKKFGGILRVNTGKPWLLNIERIQELVKLAEKENDEDLMKTLKRIIWIETEFEWK